MKLKSFVTALIGLCLVAASSAPVRAVDTRFEISYPAALDQGPITGRVFVILTRSNRFEPRLQAGSYTGSVPFFGADVTAMRPGESASIDASALGFPLKTLGALPAGDYYVQAMLNVYTEVHRKDGRKLWV